MVILFATHWMGWPPILTGYLFAALKLSPWQPSATITVTSLDVKKCKFDIFHPSRPFEVLKGSLSRVRTTSANQVLLDRWPNAKKKSSGTYISDFQIKTSIQPIFPICHTEKPALQDPPVASRPHETGSMPVASTHVPGKTLPLTETN